MTTTRKTQLAGATFGQRLREERNRQGLSAMEVSFRLRGVVPRRSQVTPETIRNYEVGTVRDERVDLVVAAGLAAVLGVTLEELSPAVADEARSAAALLRDRAPVRTGSRCTDDSAAQSHFLAPAEAA